ATTNTIAAPATRRSGTRDQPNAFDRKQVERAIRERARYRYVTPAVKIVEGGFRIESPCCSRRIDPDGGVVDIAMLICQQPGEWKLYRKDHEAARWMLHGTYKWLSDLLEELKKDPQQKFWQ
ncbi:MAG: hypothetical protein ACLP00_31865, partial [Terracidiphilus sp.]